MVISDARDAGELLGKSISEVNDFKQDFIPTEAVVDLNIVGLESTNVIGSYFVYKQNVGTAFHLDHPVNGILGSSTGLSLGTGSLGSRDLHETGLL